MNPEKPSSNPENERNDHEAERAAREQEKKIGEHLNEKAAEYEQSRTPENLEKVRHEALNEALERKEATQETLTTERQPSPAERRKDGPISKAKRDESYNTTMNEVQHQMSAPSRAFSKVIHNKAVEKVSEVAGGTIARPNAILSAAIFAFVLTLVVYLVAKNAGYRLSGFESIGAFLLGWAVGILYDFLRVMVTGRKS
ncbi:MAG TPA: hypothetical protein VLG09_00060 [Candidatus Saccharimonadales bacterium]|nr:hypothetical protein [Candidatus Saccharimonadales bacterium]